MIPATSKAFLVTNLVSGTQYDLCVLAAWEDTATTLTATNVVGCAQFYTRDEYPQCQSLRSHLLGGTMILVVGGVIVATLLVFIVILMVRYKAGGEDDPPASKLPSVSDTYSQTNGGRMLRNGLLLAKTKPKVTLRNEVVEFRCGSLQSSLSSSSSSSSSSGPLDSRDRDSYIPRGQEGALSGKWRTTSSKACPNLDHLLGAFTSLELRGQGRDPGPSGATAAAATAPPTDKEPLLGRTIDSTLSRLLMLPLDSKPKRSHSFDMGDFTCAEAPSQHFSSYPRRISRIWTKRSLSVNGMLLQFDEEGEAEGSKGTLDSSEWVMESTV